MQGKGEHQIGRSCKGSEILKRKRDAIKFIHQKEKVDNINYNKTVAYRMQVVAANRSEIMI